jgi:hypothetical protein
MVLTLIRDLPGEPGFLAPVIARLVTTRLGASVGAPGPHDFAVRIGIARRARPTRPSQPRLTCRDDRANVPLVEAGWRDKIIFSRKPEAEYFCAENWTAESALNRLTNFDFSAHAILALPKRRNALTPSITCLSGKSPGGGRDVPGMSANEVAEGELWNIGTVTTGFTPT